MSTNSTIAIARAVPADAPTLGATLARAFQDDPVFGWIIPDAHRRAACLPAVFAAFAEAYLPHDETYVAGDGAGAALWAPAGTEAVSAEQAEVLGQQLAAVLDEQDLGRAEQVAALLDEHHPAEPCAYLQFMGVVPEHQGRGLGSRLLTTVLQRCDTTGTPAYLEATSVHNRRLYQRHGFATVGEVRLPQGPVLSRMWRDAAAPDQAL